MIRVLLADDSPQAVRLAEQILSSQGLEVVSVNDGKDAISRLAEVTPDIVIADVYLTGRNAFEIARFMRSQSAYRDIPIVFAASPNDKFDEHEAKEAGADVILHKPFEASLLFSTIQHLVDQSSAAAPAGPDRNSIRAAVTIALDSAMPGLIEELTQRVLLALTSRR